MKDSNAYIDLTIAACKKVTEYITGMSMEQFLADSKTQSAVIMQLQIIGEMSKKVPTHIREHIDVPWSMIVGLRNIISHEYFMLELGTIWNIASRDVPELETKLHEYLRAQGTSYMPPFDDATPLLE
ncbi:MAG: HepT-like ribonuclease domain-containing protein [Patescibacteria group bacterium]